MCRSYFESAEPDGPQLITGYVDCMNVIDVLRDMVVSQRDDMHNATKKLYDIWSALRMLADHNTALLKGGAVNG